MTADLYIALGSNLGDRSAHLAAARAAIGRWPMTALVRTSRVFETSPVGPPGQGPYLNQALHVRTELRISGLIRHVWLTQETNGRPLLPPNEAEKWGPRTLDIDLLLYNDLIHHDPDLTLPHPRLHERPFVLAPLAELAPDLIHPILKRSIADLHAAVGNEGIIAIFPQDEHQQALTEKRP
ncbi:MAG: 2-amino-4-hydroxy-6-hydroxymethyldihydropteridine diphosphokinase [Phycisphaeraceae bacterium]